MKEKTAARAKHREELPGQVALLQQMQQMGREVCAELERRSRSNGRSWWEPDQSEWQKEQEAEEMQQLTKELQALEMQVAAVRPKVEKEAQRLQGVARLTMLEQSSGRTCGWRREEEQAEAHRVREIGQLRRKLKTQAEGGARGSWR